MVFITEDTWKKIVVVVDNVKWLNETNIEGQLCCSRLRNNTLQYPKHLRKQRQDLLKDWSKQPCRRFIREDFAIQLIMDSRTVLSIDFKSRLGFKSQDPIMKQEQSVFTKIKEIFSTEEITFQHFVLGYRIDAYFLKYNLTVEVDERGHNDRDLEAEIERQKALEKELDYKFVRINPAREKFSIFNEINRIHDYIVQSRKKLLLTKISDILLNPEFKSDHSIKKSV